MPADDRAWRLSHKRRRCESSADLVPFTMQQRIGKMDWSSYYCAPPMQQLMLVALHRHEQVCSVGSGFRSRPSFTDPDPAPEWLQHIDVHDPGAWDADRATPSGAHGKADGITRA